MKAWQNFVRDLEDRVLLKKHPITMALFYSMVDTGGDSNSFSRTLKLNEISQHQVGLHVISTTKFMTWKTMLTCLKVNKGLSFDELLWPRWEEVARVIGGDGDLGHDAGDAGLVGLSHINVSLLGLF